METKVEPAAPAAGPTGGGTAAPLRSWLKRNARYSGLLIGNLLLIAIFTFLTPQATFFSFENGLGVLRSMTTLALVGLGATLVFCLGEIDLSFGYVYGLCAMVMAVSWLVWGWPLWIAVVLAFAVAIAVGTFNAALTTRMGIQSFIVTLGSGALCFGFTLLIGGGRSFNYNTPVSGVVVDPGQVQAFANVGGALLPGGFPAQGIWLIVAVVVFYLVLDRSLFGFRLKAIGGNPSAARVARLPVIRYKWIAFVVVASMACLAALLDFSFIGTVTPGGGQTLLFPVFSAVIIGGASLSGGSGSTLGTVSGALLLALMANGFAVLAVGGWAQQMMTGVVIMFAVMIDRIAATRLRG